MLVLSRRVNEEIVIDDHIRLRVVEVRGDRVRLGVCAPASVRVDRQEVHERRMMEPCPGTSQVEKSVTSHTGESHGKPTVR
jgi:carbon storage regulator